MDNDRAPYGAAMLKQLAECLSQDYSNGFNYYSLIQMVKFYTTLPDERIVATLSQQLIWSHFVELIKIDDEIKHEFYIYLCADAVERFDGPFIVRYKRHRER